jgi:large subunit ribosomal protein L10
MRKQDKPKFVNKLTEELKSASSVVLVDYTGLSVKMQQELKKGLKEVDATLSVVKNTLFRRAASEVKSPEEALSDTVLSGPTAIVVTKDDPIAPLQILAKFAKTHEVPNFKVGIIEGSFQDKDALTKLAKLPGKDALVAQAVGTIAQPLNGIVWTLQAKLQDLISVLKQASEKS